MTSPYTGQPADAFMAAQTSVGLLLAAFLWFRSKGAWATVLVLLAAVAIAIVAPVFGDFWTGLGGDPDPQQMHHLLKLSAALATIAMATTGRPGLAILGLLGQGALWFVTDYTTGCDLELSATHVAFYGLLAGALRTTGRPPVFTGLAGLAAPPGAAWVSAARDDAWMDDVVAFFVATVAAAIVSTVVLHRWTNSGDEWADTFQAALFAKLRAYGDVPHCSEAFRSFWVFQYMGRSFAQYPPGWPAFMAPFVAIRAPWLAGPASLGVLAAGVSRLTRTFAMSTPAGSPPVAPAHARAAGRFAAMAVTLSATMLINGASRYPHVFVAAMFAWAVVGLCAIATGKRPSAGLLNDRPKLWGAVLGACAALLLAARPGDGAMLGIGLFAYFVYALARRRMAWQAIAAATAAFLAVAGASLLILHAQLGKWFTTGYSLTAVIYPWVKSGVSLPRPDQFRWGIPLGTGAYCWWPCSPAIGLAGLAALRGRARRLGFIFFFSYVPFFVFYTALEFGREGDLGYGPRFQLPAIVPMAVGTGVILAHLWNAGQSPVRSVLAGRGTFALAFGAVILGVVRLAPLLYPNTRADVLLHNQVHEAVAHADLHDAIVLAGGGLINTDAMDLTENLPLELYPEQEVLIAQDKGPDLERCIRQQYPHRKLYRAQQAGSSVKIVPVH